jgi:hypothetical protein
MSQYILYAGMMVCRKCAGTGRSGGKDDSSLIALHSFSFTQKIEDHSSLLSVHSIYKSDVPTSGHLSRFTRKGRKGVAKNNVE